MPRIHVVCVQRSTGQLLANQLTGVLGAGVQAEIVPVVPGPLPERLSADLVLLTSRPLAPEVNRRVTPGTPILVTNRTLWRRDWQQIMALPARTRMLMVHETLETAHNTITLLYELGVKHLELLPYAPGAELPGGVDLALTCSHPHLVPPAVERVMDIGPRPLDPLTILEVMSRLDLLNEESSLRLQGWMGKTMARSHGLVAAIAWLGELRQQFETVLDFSGEAMIACDAAGRVTVCNRRAEELFGLRATEAVGEPAGVVLAPCGLEEVLVGRSPAPNRPIRVGNRDLVVTCVPLRRQGQLVGAAAICRPAADMGEGAALAVSARERGQAARYTFADLVGQSQAFREVTARARQVARSDSTVLILGETGTGKEMLAQAIHNASPRQQRPFVAVNCAALPESLVESELFGYEEGAFTGAARGGRRGLFEQAQGGTIFLDEIGDISLPVQARLLRVLEEREVLRVGGSRLIPIDVRVMAATNQDLSNLVAAGRFRADLYYRLNVLPLRIPPLRQRPEDIPLLVRNFLTARGHTRPLAPPVMAVLTQHPWPGNLRELRNCIEYMVTVSAGEITPADLPATVQTDATGFSAGAGDGAATVDAAGAAPELLAILHAIARATESGERSGRGSLARRLRAAGVVLTEAEVRARLTRLTAAGLLVSGQGRQGTRLSAAGYAFLRQHAH